LPSQAILHICHGDGATQMSLVFTSLSAFGLKVWETLVQ